MFSVLFFVVVELPMNCAATWIYFLPLFLLCTRVAESVSRPQLLRKCYTQRVSRFFSSSPRPAMLYKQPFNFVYSTSNCIVYAAVLPIMDPLSFNLIIVEGRILLIGAFYGKRFTSLLIEGVCSSVLKFKKLIMNVFIHFLNDSRFMFTLHICVGLCAVPPLATSSTNNQSRNRRRAKF